MSDLPREEIKGFLRSRRARIEPTLMELAADLRPRRVAGLRREEVAARAAISLDYYIQLERGNVRGVSEQVLESVMDALELDDVERHYLAELVAAVDRRHHDDAAIRVPDDVATLVCATTGVAVVLRNHRMDALATNSLGHALYRWLDAVPGRNIARHVFLDPASRGLYPDYDELADYAAGTLRASLAAYPDDATLTALIDELRDVPDFEERWSQHPVLRFGSGRIRFRDPAAGDMTLVHTQLLVRESPDLVITAYAPADDASAAAFARLDELPG